MVTNKDNKDVINLKAFFLVASVYWIKQSSLLQNLRPLASYIFKKNHCCIESYKTVTMTYPNMENHWGSNVIWPFYINKDT